MRNLFFGRLCVVAISCLSGVTALGQTVVGPGESLSISSSTTEDFLLTGGTLEPTNVTLSGSIELQDDSKIIRPQNDLVLDGRGNPFEPRTGPTMLTGPFSGAGDLEIGDFSRDEIIISGDSIYDGHTYVTSGEIIATSATAFGSTIGGTTIQSGEVSIWEPMQEQFRVEGGALEFNDGDVLRMTPITIAGGEVSLPRQNLYTVPVVVDGVGGTLTFGARENTASWIGGSSGIGDLRINGRGTVDTPLTHDGDLIIKGMILNAVNTYTGKTIFDTSDSIAIDRADVFGTSTTPLEVHDGTVVVNVLPDGNRGFLVRQGTLDMRVDTPIPSKIILGGGFSAQLTSNSVFNGPLELNGPEISRVTIRGGTFNGGISGAARQLTLGGSDPVVLNSNNDYQAITLSSGEQPVEINANRALGDTEQGTRVSSHFNFNTATDEPIVVTSRGKVNLNAQQGRFPRFADLDSSELDRLHTVEVNVPSAYSEDVDVAEGTLQINSNTSLGKLAITKNGAVRIAESKTLDIGSKDLMFQEGLIDGSIRGSGTLRKTTTARGEIQHLPSFDGDIVVERGTLEVFSADSLGTAAGTTYISEKDAVLSLRNSQFDPPLVIEDDIFLNNSTGVDHKGGLFAAPLCCGRSGSIVQLRGRLDLGTEGSIIGGAGKVELTGPISGGGLTTHGEKLRIRIFNGDNAYSGITHVRQSTVELSGHGRLTSTSRIVLNEGPEAFDGTLILNNSEQSQPDRIPDTAPIDFRGGELQATGGTEESLGQVNFIEGDSRIDLSVSFNGNESSRQLHVAGIDRQAGATARFTSASNGQLNVAELPNLSGGILPWLVVRDSFSSSTFDSFGTVVDGRVRGLSSSSYVTSFSAAGRSGNVVVSNTNEMLYADIAVNSLTFGISHSQVNLGGHELKVASGGVILGNGGRLENGTIVPGETNELIFYGRGAVNANITDSDSGSVSVTYAGGSSGLNLSGNNTYSGTTYLNEGAAYLENANALPDNGDLVIVGGDLQIGFVATEAKPLGKVRIAGDGALTQSFTGRRGQGIFSFEEIILEEGDLIPGQLVGSGDIIKRTIDPASIVADRRSTYSGNVIVEEGRLTSGGLPMATYMVRGGALDLRDGDNAIAMDGGTLYLSTGLEGNIEVLSPSTISTESMANKRYRVTHSGQLSGPGALSLTGEVRFRKIRHEINFSNNSPVYTGDVTIDSILVAADQPQSLGTGNITVLSGGILRFGGRSLSSEHPSFDFLNNIDLRGGEFYGSDSDRQPRQLVGDLRVSEHSMIGEMNVAGTTYLEDGSRLTTFRQGVLRFLGDIKIGGMTELEYGLQQIVSNAAGTNGGVVQLLGTISSDAEESVLNLIDRGLDEIVLDVSYHVADGQTLQILKDGQPMVLEVEGMQNMITGGGTLLNPVKFKEGATISPGSFPGVLSLGDSATLGADSMYEWEINDVIGEAGQSVGWDLLQVGGELIFDATQKSPFVFKVIGLDETGKAGIIDNFDPTQNYEWLIASANSISGFDPTTIQVDASSFINNNPLPNPSRLSLKIDGANLFLVHQVPEPTSWILLSLGLVSIATKRRNLLG